MATNMAEDGQTHNTQLLMDLLYFIAGFVKVPSLDLGIVL